MLGKKPVLSPKITRSGMVVTPVKETRGKKSNENFFFLAIMKEMSMLKRQHLYCTREIQAHNFLLYISMLQLCQEPCCGTLGG